MKFAKILNFIIFLISIIIFLITVKITYALAISCDVLGASFSDMVGGDFNLFLFWTRLFLSFIIGVLSLINLLLKFKK